MTNANMTPDQIRKAEAAGIITAAQARTMLGESSANAAVIGQEDDMRFLRSFSDVFIALGLVILMLGLSGLTKLFGGARHF